MSEREKERKRKTDREREKATEKEREREREPLSLQNLECTHSVESFVSNKTLVVFFIDFSIKSYGQSLQN